jgi:hypothetical protein
MWPTDKNDTKSLLLHVDLCVQKSLINNKRMFESNKDSQIHDSKCLLLLLIIIYYADGSVNLYQVYYNIVPIVDGIYKSKKLNISFQFLFVSLTAVVIFERRWQFHGFGLLDAIEVCESEPGRIDVYVWKEQSRRKREYRLLWRYTING